MEPSPGLAAPHLAVHLDPEERLALRRLARRHRMSESALVRAMVRRLAQEGCGEGNPTVPGIPPQA